MAFLVVCYLGTEIYVFYFLSCLHFFTEKKLYVSFMLFTGFYYDSSCLLKNRPVGLSKLMPE
jgi:hypothetical protein